MKPHKRTYEKDGGAVARTAAGQLRMADLVPVAMNAAKKAAKKAAIPFGAVILIFVLFEAAIFFAETPRVIFAAQNVILITSTASTTWTVPADWNNSSNTIEVIGAGGGGDAGAAVSSGAGAGGGGGGAYSKALNVALTPGASVGIKIGAGGAAAGAGGDTYLCSSTSNCASITGTAVVAGAKGGTGASGATNGAGGAAASGVGSVTANGGAGGAGAAGSGNNGGAGGGGGGAGGCGAASCAAGSPGAAGNAGSGQTGGQGDGTFGGAGGVADTAGSNGTEWSAAPAYGSGGGGGGGTGGAIHANGNPGQLGGTYGAGGGGGGGEGKGATSGGAGAQGIQGVIVITYTPFVPTITVSATGTAISSVIAPSTGFMTGGAFTMSRDSSSTNVTRITVTATGTLNANANLSNLILFYQQSSACATSGVPGGATQFNASGSSFNASNQAVATGTMSVGTSNVCIYAKVNVGSGSGAGQTFSLEIANPSTDVIASSGNVAPATSAAPAGVTTLPGTTLVEQDFRIYHNIDAVQPTTSLAALDTSATNIISGEVIRVRLNIAVSGAALATSSQAFKLQYAAEGGYSSCAGIPTANFADVGAVGASFSAAPLRGFSNTSTADGSPLTATLLPSSTVPESYAAQNPTAVNPNAIPSGGAGEWDFAVEDNDASSSAAYCFRAMTSAGAALGGYVDYPLIGTVQSATWRAAENAATSTTWDTSVRLRMELSNNGNSSDSGAYQLEYSTSTAGPWTKVPVDPSCVTTAAAFRVCPSGFFADLDPTHNLLTPAASLFINGFMLENTNPAPTIALAPNQFTELEWNIQATEASAVGQTYYFRASDNGAPIGTYSVYPALNVVAASSTFTQYYFRWYANINSLTPSSSWANLGENAGITSADSPPVSGNVLRLRMDATVGTAMLPTSTQAFKLQYSAATSSCSAAGGWTDVGAQGSSAAWRGYANPGVTNGTPLSTNPPTAGQLLLSVSNRSGAYADSNPSALNPYKALVGDNVEYDWSLEDNTTSSAGSYCFRMVESSGTPLSSYTYYPTVTTAAFNPESANWRFYGDASDETPVSPIAAENAAPSNVINGDIFKLRMAVAETNGVPGNDVKFGLQFSPYSNFSSGTGTVAEVGNCSSGSEWCYATSTGGIDNAVISTAVLSDSNSCASGAGPGCGTHNTSGVSSSTFSQAAGAVTEYEFTLKGDGATANQAYFFRAVDASTGVPLPLYGTSSYPSLVTEGALLTFTVSGLPQGTTTDGVVTSVSSTAISIPFGTLAIATSVIGGQELSLTTNAPDGFELYTFQDAPLTNGLGDTVPGIAATNASPQPWETVCTATSTACYGYHPSSAVLSGGSTRFAANDTYAALTSTPAEIGFANGPSTSTINIVYRIQAGPTLVNGSYDNNIIYIAAPVF